MKIRCSGPCTRTIPVEHRSWWTEQQEPKKGVTRWFCPQHDPLFYFRPTPRLYIYRPVT